MENNRTIQDENIDAICSELNKYIMERFEYKTPPAYRTLSDNIMVHSRVKFNLYLRCYYEISNWPANTIVIARLGFLKTRKGHGTHFLKFLKEIALKYDFEFIGIECANKNSSAFAKHFKFEEFKSEKHISNYIIRVEMLEVTTCDLQR